MQHGYYKKGWNQIKPTPLKYFLQVQLSGFHSFIFDLQNKQTYRTSYYNWKRIPYCRPKVSLSKSLSI